MKLMLLMVCLISLPGYASVDLVKVDKSERIMYLMNGNQVVKQFRIALGANPKGHKRQQGDEKTPEGTYTLDYKKEDSSFYRAMHISYPNEQDIANARKAGVSPGGLIMVHGQKNGFGSLGHVAQRFNWTDGCIALTNHEMDEFMALVKVGTPIRIEW
ncbi:L,D-transpeptidase family protein [Vibrio aerogenes]|nr:L,D-transpeptidase family protein [Vibrio aerogenes]